ncbi:bis-aminopropyl spermidine synthase family protein [bacterium]|nr:bis-aminopropyl spermidine synthase family protein [bacterium]
MANYWLTQHLDTRFGSQSGEVVLCNLAYGSRILADEQSFKRLAPFQQSHPLGDDPWLERALDANLLVNQDDREPPNCVARLLAALETYTGQSGQPLQLLEAAEQRYRQQSMPKAYSGPIEKAGPLLRRPERLVDFAFDHTRAFLTHDQRPEQGLDLSLVEMFSQRPAMKLRYEQQYCTPFTTQQRVARMRETLKPGARVLVLGDDDLVSLALVHSSDQYQVDVLELDPDLVAFLKDKGGERLNVLEHNLRHGVPESMRSAYDLVTTDPPYAAHGMRFFLECAADSLKPGPDSRLFLSTFPGLIEDPDKLWQDLNDLGLHIQRRQDHFSRYIYNNGYRVEHLAALRGLGSPLHPTQELLGFPFLYAHFFECLRPG